MEKQVKGSPRPEDIVTWKMNQDPQYADKIVNDLEFAKSEFSAVGLTIDPKAHEELRKANKLLQDATANLIHNVKLKPNLVIIYAPIIRPSQAT